MKKIILSLIIVSSSISYAAAGGSGSHGSNVSVCGNSVELADLREVSLRPGLNARLNIQESDDSVDQQIERALKRLDQLDQTLGSKIRAYVSEIRSTTRFIETYDWGFSNDVNLYPVEKGCELRTVVHYFYDNFIEVRKDLFDRLSKTHQAATWVHEGVFRAYRETNEDSLSLVTRRLVAYLFSDSQDVELAQSLLYRYFVSKSIASKDISSSTSSRLDLRHFGVSLVDAIQNSSSSERAHAGAYDFSSLGCNIHSYLKRNSNGDKIHGHEVIHNRKPCLIKMKIRVLGINNTLDNLWNGTRGTIRVGYYLDLNQKQDGYFNRDILTFTLERSLIYNTHFSLVFIDQGKLEGFLEGAMP